MDELKALGMFAKVAESGSFRRAAIEQGVAPQAASKTVAQLEAALGVRLFHRTTRKLGLTDEGTQLLARALPALEAVRAAMDGARAVRSEGGVVRVTAPRSMGLRLVMPLVGEFMQAHPQLRVDVELDDHFTDLVAQKIDVGFRAGARLERNFVARRLLDIQHCICASPAYVERHGRPRRWEDLARHRCTGFKQVSSGKLLPWEHQGEDGVSLREVPAVFTTNDVEAELHAVLDGVGIGQLPTYLVAAAIREGRLLHLLPRHTTERMGLYLYYPQRSHQPARVRAFIDFVSERLQSRDRFHLLRR
jgi:DNA-binding transcriptional LysR family regulator